MRPIGCGPCTSTPICSTATRAAKRMGLNVAGVEITFRFTVLITALALGVLVVFWTTAIPYFDLSYALDIEPDPGRSVWLPKGPAGILAALPFAIWFFLAIEQLPLAAEEGRTDYDGRLP